MSLMDKCSELWGDDRIKYSDPPLDVYRDVHYLPFAPGVAWGLFDRDGRAVESAVDYREGRSTSHSQVLQAPGHALTLHPSAPDQGYVYGGTINAHYGHFLVNTLPRFWCMSRIKSPNTKILCHGPGGPDDWFRVPFIASIFSKLGLSVDDFASFDRPTFVRNIVVPATSLEEQHIGYAAYGRLCRELGARIYARADIDTSEVPVYYSKSRLQSAVGNIVNEHEIDTVMRSEGVDVVYPEALSFVEQVRLMASRKYILGSAGSFFHTSIFCPPRSITCLNVSLQINSNFSIIDKLSENQATYYYPSDIEVLDKVDGFLTSRRLPHAEDVARELLSYVPRA